MDPSWIYFDWFLAFGKLVVMLLAQIAGVSGGLDSIGGARFRQKESATGSVANSPMSSVQLNNILLILT
jgi:hypothetical protein